MNYGLLIVYYFFFCCYVIMFAKTQPALSTNKYQLPSQVDVSVENTDTEFEKILAEYSLKRNNFNPTTPSPNLFINKLKKRFNCYYS